MQIVFLWVVILCSLVGGYQCYGGTSVVRVEGADPR